MCIKKSAKCKHVKNRFKNLCSHTKKRMMGPTLTQSQRVFREKDTLYIPFLTFLKCHFPRVDPILFWPFLERGNIYFVTYLKKPRTLRSKRSGRRSPQNQSYNTNTC